MFYSFRASPKSLKISEFFWCFLTKSFENWRTREAVDVVDVVDVVDERLRMGDMTAANVVDDDGCV